MLTIKNNLTSLVCKPATWWVTDAGTNLERDNMLSGQVYHTPQRGVTDEYRAMKSPDTELEILN
jgi:hypothetical protein